MKILFIAHRLPYPPNKGEKIRAFNNIKHLSKNHEISLVCLSDKAGETDDIGELRDMCKTIDIVYRSPVVSKVLGLFAMLRGRSGSVASFYSPRLAKKVNEVLERISIERVHIYTCAMAEYVWDFDGVKIVDFVDVDSEKWKVFSANKKFPLSLIYKLEHRLLAEYETRVANDTDHSVLISEAEAAILRSRDIASPISVVPMGVDLEFNNPASVMSDRLKDTIVFVGVMDYFPNVDAVHFFCSEIFPRVLAEFPEARFLIVGRNPVRAVRRLENDHNVKVVGEVPDVRPFVGRARLSVAPFRIARGVQTKVLESLALGVPVVATSISVQGIRKDKTSGIQIAQGPTDFAKHVCDLLRDDMLQKRCAAEGRGYVERHYRWDEHNAHLEAILRNP